MWFCLERRAAKDTLSARDCAQSASDRLRMASLLLSSVLAGALDHHCMLVCLYAGLSSVNRGASRPHARLCRCGRRCWAGLYFESGKAAGALLIATLLDLCSGIRSGSRQAACLCMRVCNIRKHLIMCRARIGAHMQAHLHPGPMQLSSPATLNPLNRNAAGRLAGVILLPPFHDPRPPAEGHTRDPGKSIRAAVHLARPATLRP